VNPLRDFSQSYSVAVIIVPLFENAVIPDWILIFGLSMYRRVLGLFASLL